MMHTQVTYSNNGKDVTVVVLNRYGEVVHQIVAAYKSPALADYSTRLLRATARRQARRMGKSKS